MALIKIPYDKGTVDLNVAEKNLAAVITADLQCSEPEKCGAAYVEEALAKIPADLSKYTSQSIKAVNSAKNAVVWGRDSRQQDAVDAWADAIESDVAALEEKGLIRTEPSTITTKDGRMRNGSLIYTIRPIQEALELNYQRQFLQAERDMERAKAEKRLAELNRQNKKEERA